MQQGAAQKWRLLTPEVIPQLMHNASDGTAYHPVLLFPVQMRCVEILLKAGAAMNLRQMNIILDALPTLEEPKVPHLPPRLQALFAFMRPQPLITSIA